MLLGSHRFSLFLRRLFGWSRQSNLTTGNRKKPVRSKTSATSLNKPSHHQLTGCAAARKHKSQMLPTSEPMFAWLLLPAVEGSFWWWSWNTRFALHAFAEPGQSARLLLVAALPEPALDGPHIPVQLLGQAFQSLLIWMLFNTWTQDQVSSSLKTSVKNNKNNTCSTLVIAVKTFSRIALDCAFCGPLAWIFRPLAHGLAMNLRWKDQQCLVGLHNTENYIITAKGRQMVQSSK